MQTDHARPTAKAIDTQTGEVRQSRTFVAVLMTDRPPCGSDNVEIRRVQIGEL
jgi:hypothetical protein